MGILHRLVLPKHTGVVVGSAAIARNLQETWIRAEDPLAYVPGQYVIMMIGGQVPRNYSIASFDETKKTFSLIVNIATGGVGARTISSLHEGETVTFCGPTGDFIYTKTMYQQAWCICVGSGLAPLLPIMQQARNDGTNVHLFFGAKNQGDIPPLGGVSDQLTCSITSDDPFWEGECGRIQQVVARHIANAGEVTKNDRLYYICGMPQMVKDTRELLTSLGIRKENLRYEGFGF